MIKKENYKDLVIVLLAIVLLFSVRTCVSNSQKLNEQSNLVTSLNDSIHTWKDKNNLYHSEKQIIETSNPKDFIDIKSKNKEIIALQSLVKQYKNQLGSHGSVALIKGETQIDTFYTKPIIVYRDNTLWKDSIHNKWINWDYSVRKDSTINKAKIDFKLKMDYEYAIINKEKSNGWFKKPTPYAEVVNYNPYSKNISQTVYRVINDIKPKRIGLGVYGGYGLNLGDVVTTGWQIGIGGSYNFVNF